MAASLTCDPPPNDQYPKVEAKVYDENNSYLAGGGPWDCNKEGRKGTVTGIKAGSNRKVVIFAKDSAGNIKYRGEKTGITVNANQNNDAGPIPVNPFDAPTLSSPSNGSSTNDNTPTFDWSDVTDVSGVTYELLVDNNSNFSSPEINQTNLSSSTYTPAISLSEQLYYWEVRAKDSFGNVSVWSDVWSFIVSTTVSDTTPPTPNPMTFATQPYAASSTSISMVATTATDSQSPPVSYYFDFVDSTTGGTGGTDSSWQSSTSYTDTGLQPNHQYGYRVKTRDSASTPNETSYSSTVYKYTLANAPGTASFSNITQTSIRANWTANSNRSGTQYYCENTTKGTNSGWITNTYWDSTGLSCETSYSFRAKAKNGDGTETGWTNLGSQSTQACPIPPVLNATPTSLDFGSSNTSASLFITNTGGGTLTWSVTDDKTWLNVSPPSGTTTTEADTPSVTVSRTGLARGSYSGSISITSDGGNQTIPVSMSVPNHDPVITSTPVTTATVGTAYSYDYDVNATDSDGDTLTYSLTTSPTGMTINSSTGVISWTPTSGGDYTVTVYVSDVYGGSATQNFTISVVTNVSGIISSNTTWTLSGSPYIVTGSVIVNSGVTLTIEPGVTVKFNSGLALQIDGTLIAKGTSTQKITFTSNKSSPAAGDWGYILFSDSSVDATYDGSGNYTGGSILEYCTVEYAGGVSVSDNGAVRMNNAHPFINYCTIKNNSASGIYAYSLTGTLKIMNSSLSNNTAISGGGIYTYGGTVTISSNTINNNTTTNGGGGIATSYGTVIISNNTINNNTSTDYYSGNGGGIYIDESRDSRSFTISKNIISNNTSRSVAYGGGGLYISFGAGTVSNNIINSNSASPSAGSGGSGGNGGGIYIYAGDWVTPITISNNIISSNSTLSSANSGSNGGGIYRDSDWEGNVIFNNSIIRNTAKNSAALNFTSTENFKYNVVTGNIATALASNYVLKVESSPANPTINNNNLFNNTATYELWNSNAQGSTNVDAKNNWWGSATESQYWIYDFVDDSTKGIVDYSPYATSIRTDTPISPPTGLTTTAGTGTITLSWSANPESDTAGYKVYWDTDSGYPYANSADVGTVTSYTIGSLPVGTYYVTVTAYDTTASTVTDDPNTIVNEIQTAGNESWFAEEKTVNITSSPYVAKLSIAEIGQESPSPQPSPASGEGAKGGFCFIATAAYGSYLDPHVEVLREFRDKYLIADFKIQIAKFKIELPNYLGRAFVNFYYKYSPPIANYIRQHETLRTATRWALTPVVYGIRYPSISIILIVAAGVVWYTKKRRKLI